MSDSASRRLQASTIASGGFGGVLLTVIDLGELLARGGRCRALGCVTDRARCWPLRQMPAGALLTPRVEHLDHAPGPGYEQDHEVNPGGYESPPEYSRVIGVESSHPQGCIKHDRRNHYAYGRLDAVVFRRPRLGPGRLAQPPCPG